MQTKINDRARTVGQTGRKISTKKTKHFRMNSTTEAAITLNGEDMEDIEDFIYLGSKMTTSGDTEVEIRTKNSKAS